MQLVGFGNETKEKEEKNQMNYSKIGLGKGETQNAYLFHWMSFI